MLCWAVALTWLQPLTEPVKPWADIVVENNTYWVRDVRWAMIVLALVSLVWAWRGDLKRTAFGTLAAVGWIGADTWLDRLDVAGTAMTVTLSLVAVGVVLAAHRLTTSGTSRPRPAVLAIAATVTATLAGLFSALRTPFPEHDPVAAAAAVLSCSLAIVIAMGCASSIHGRFATSAVVFTVVFIGLATGVVFLPWQYLLWGSVLVTALAQVAVAGRVLASPITIIGYTVSTIILVPIGLVLSFSTMVADTFLQPGGYFTAWADNVRMSTADTEALFALNAVVIGAIVGSAIALVARNRTPAPSIQ